LSYSESDEDGVIDRGVALELRSGVKQDVLPPSVHPVTCMPYEWVEGSEPLSARWGGRLPELPDSLRAVWEGCLDESSPTCAVVNDILRPGMPIKRARTPSSSFEPGDWVDVNPERCAYNESHTVAGLLEKYGYQKMGDRFRRPGGEGEPGVVILPGNGVAGAPHRFEAAFSHHQGEDPLTGHGAHDAFALFCKFEHNDRRRDAYQALAHTPAALERTRLHNEEIAGWLANASAAQARLAAQAAADLHRLIEKSGGDPDYIRMMRGERPRAEAAARQPHIKFPPGILSEIIPWMMDGAKTQQVELATAGALALCSIALAKKVASPTGCRPSLYLNCLASTAVGKEFQRECITMAAIDSGMLSDTLQMISRKPASSQAIPATLAANGGVLYLLDEVHHQLNKWAKTTDGGEIIETILSLHNSAATLVMGSDRADRKLNPTAKIKNPYLVLYCTSTQENFWASMQSGHATSGWANRFLLVESSVKKTRADCRVRVQVPQKTPARVVEWLRAARQIGCFKVDGSPEIDTSMDQPVALKYAPGAEEQLFLFSEYIFDNFNARGGDESLWGRAEDHALRLATILACSRLDSAEKLLAGAHEGIWISAVDMAWAISFVKQSCWGTQKHFAMSVADSPFEARSNAALDMIVKAGAGGIARSVLANNCRPLKIVSSKERADVFLSLEERGMIWHTQEGKAVRFFAAEHAGACLAAESP
jgi:hypothetical protein